MGGGTNKGRAVLSFYSNGADNFGPNSQARAKPEVKTKKKKNPKP